MHQSAEDEEAVTAAPILCCCEYIDRNRERNHLAACCCNCVDLDVAFDRLICCARIPQETRTNMLLTFQDRLRIPWRGGAKLISLSTLLPFVVIPTALCLAAVSLGWTCFVAATLAAFMWYVDWRLKFAAPRSKFYLMWNLVSVSVLWILFEQTVPLLEVLPEENNMLILLMSISCISFYGVKLLAPRNHVVRSTSDEGSLPDITEVDEYSPVLHDDLESGRQASEETETDDSAELDPNICPHCRKYTPPRTFHCAACQVCVVRLDHHNVWLDCCVGQSNYRLYLFAGLVGILACLLGANLALTAICHPFLIFSVMDVHVFLPDDCSEVYEIYDIGLCFVGALYALIMALVLFIDVIRQIWFICKGVTWEEHLRGETGARRGNAFYNCKAFFCREWIRISSRFRQ